MGISRLTLCLIFSLLALIGLVVLLKTSAGGSSEAAPAQAPSGIRFVSTSDDATATATETASMTVTPAASPSATATAGVPPLATPARYAAYSALQETSTSVTIPLVFRNLTFQGASDWNSAIRVQNTSAISTSVVVRLRDTNGASAGY